MDDERVPDLPLRNGLMNVALERNQTAERFDLEYMMTHLDDPEVVARLCAQESFLQKCVFRGLNHLKPVWDSPEIAHFNADDFIRLIDRCTVLGVRIIGIEIFTTEGQVLGIEIPEADSNSWCVSFVQKYQERIDLSICATYEVPGRVLNMPPESLKSLDQTAHGDRMGCIFLRPRTLRVLDSNYSPRLPRNRLKTGLLDSSEPQPF